MKKYFIHPEQKQYKANLHAHTCLSDGKLTPDTPLTGQFAESDEAADVDAVVAEIKAAFAEQEERLERIRQAAEE